jgi:hypothetical protein
MRRSLLSISKNENVFKILVYLAGVVILLVSGCTVQTKNSSFDAQQCLDDIPRRVPGLKIISGPRTEESIIRDMVAPICYGRGLFARMKSNDQELDRGSVVFRVVVEYTGEVYKVTVEQTTIQSEEFLRRVSDFIMDTDFVYWARHDKDTVFLYPVTFGY